MKQNILYFCASFLRISVVTKLLSFVSALNSRKHAKLNNEKISSVAYPEFFLVYINVKSTFYEKRKEIYRVVFNFFIFFKILV